MSKITCEVCGTVFPDSASRCPICGWSPEGDAPQAEPEMGEFDVNAPKAEAPAAPAPVQQQGRRIFDFDEANGPKITTANTEEDDDTPYYGGQPGMEEEPRKTNTALVVILVVFIALVLLATGVLVVKFLLPGKKTEKPAVATVPTIVAETLETQATEETEETTEAPTIPCTSLYAQTVETLKAEGEMWRLNVKASPEDTTDVLTYSSEDEKVVTVSEEGNLTAVGNGSTNIVVTCGSQTLKCPVTVAIEETEPTTEATEAKEAETEATEETKKSSGDVTLKLKRTDMTFSRLGVYTTIELDCDLKPEDVTWRTSNSAIANVNNGIVTAMGPGIAKITVKYGDQEVSCVVRCKF